MNRRIPKSRREFLARLAQAGAGVAFSGLSGCFPNVGGSWPNVSEVCENLEAITPVETPSRVAEVHRSIITEMTDVIINCPVLKTHGVSGVTAALKNIFGIKSATGYIDIAVRKGYLFARCFTLLTSD